MCVELEVEELEMNMSYFQYDVEQTRAWGRIVKARKPAAAVVRALRAGWAGERRSASLPGSVTWMQYPDEESWYQLLITQACRCDTFFSSPPLWTQAST